MALSNIEDMLDHLRRIKSGGDLNVGKIDQIKTLEIELRFFRTFIKYHRVRLPDSLVKITKKAQLMGKTFPLVFGGITDECKTNLNAERLVSQLLDFFEGNNSATHNFALNDSCVSDHMDYLEKNLNDAPKYLIRSSPSLTKEIKILQKKTDRFLKQVKIIQKKMSFLRYLYATEINGYIDHEKLEGLKIRIQFMAYSVGQFCLAVWFNEDGDDTTGIEMQPSNLLCLIVLVELEMNNIFIGEAKASKYIRSRNLKAQKFPKGFSRNLHHLLVYLRKQNLKNSLTNVVARNTDVAIEFLLVFLGDVPNRVINGKRLTEVLEKVEMLVGDILYVENLLMRSTIKDATSKINLGTRHIQEKLEHLKAEVEMRYYKSLKFTLSQFPWWIVLSKFSSKEIE